jgi:hypothetical protein
MRQSHASKDVNTEAEEATALEAVTRRQAVMITQQTEKISYVIIIFITIHGAEPFLRSR